MTEDLINEIEAINSIYGPQTIQIDASEDYCILTVPKCKVSLRFRFSDSYPQYRPQTVGIQSTGSGTQKGFATLVLNTADRLLKEIFTPGSVCLFDLIQELEKELSCEREECDKNDSSASDQNSTEAQTSQPVPPVHGFPQWYQSQVIIEKKSAFVANAAHVYTVSAAQDAIAHLLSTDKKVAKATHNITAYRIRDAKNPAITYQDCDDDGEDFAGRRLLHLLQVMDVCNVLVVVSRWFGGVKLGSDRFRLINQVARMAIVEGKWAKGEEKAS